MNGNQWPDVSHPFESQQQSSFTWRGAVDDFTATVTVNAVDTNGVTNSVSALVERNGNFWIENLPLVDGTNTFTLKATDAAGNSSSTNINVVKSPVNLTMYRATAGATTVNGTMDTSGYTIRVNGVEAEQDGGYWTATNVPMVSMGNTTIYQVQAIANSGSNTVVIEASEDKPEGAYISSYSESWHLELFDLDTGDHGTWDYTLNWQDGKGGKATDTEKGVHGDGRVYDDYSSVSKKVSKKCQSRLL